MTSIVSVEQVRNRRLGASEVAACLGISPYEPPISVWCRLTGRAVPRVESEPMYWGSRLESIVRSEYVERHKVNVLVPKTSTLHPTIPYLGATSDGIVLDGDRWVHGLQIKAPGFHQLSRWGTSDDPETPVEIITQVAAEMACCGFPFVDVAALIGGQTYVERRVHRDAELEADILTGVEEFMRLVDSDTPPAVDGSDAYTQHLKAKLKRREDIVTATPRAETLAEGWKQCEVEIKRLSGERDHLRNMFLAEMVAKGAQKMRTAIGVVSASENEGKRDWKALAIDLSIQLGLRGVPVDLDEEVKRFTTEAAEGKWTLRRPQNWTKEV